MSIILSLAVPCSESGPRRRQVGPARISGKDEVRIYGTRTGNEAVDDAPLQPAYQGKSSEVEDRQVVEPRRNKDERCDCDACDPPQDETADPEPERHREWLSYVPAEPHDAHLAP